MDPYVNESSVQISQWGQQQPVGEIVILLGPRQMCVLSRLSCTVSIRYILTRDGTWHISLNPAKVAGASPRCGDNLLDVANCDVQTLFIRAARRIRGRRIWTIFRRNRSEIEAFDRPAPHPYM